MGLQGLRASHASWRGIAILRPRAWRRLGGHGLKELISTNSHKAMSHLRAKYDSPGRPKKGPRRECHQTQKNQGPWWDAIQPRESGREVAADLLWTYERLSTLREIRILREIRQESLLSLLNGQGPCKGQAKRWPTLKEIMRTDIHSE